MWLYKVVCPSFPSHLAYHAVPSIPFFCDLYFTYILLFFIIIPLHIHASYFAPALITISPSNSCQSPFPVFNLQYFVFCFIVCLFCSTPFPCTLPSILYYTLLWTLDTMLGYYARDSVGQWEVTHDPFLSVSHISLLAFLLSVCAMCFVMFCAGFHLGDVCKHC